MLPFSSLVMFQPRKAVGKPIVLIVYFFCRVARRSSMRASCDAVTRKSSILTMTRSEPLAFLMVNRRDRCRFAGTLEKLGAFANLWCSDGRRSASVELADELS